MEQSVVSNLSSPLRKEYQEEKARLMLAKMRAQRAHLEANGISAEEGKIEEDATDAVSAVVDLNSL